MRGERTGMPHFRGILAATSVAVVMSVVVPGAFGATGTYSVLSCSEPTGTVNPATGWTQTPAATGVGVAMNGCLANGTLAALLNSPNPGGDASASWQFAAPANTRIVRFAAQRSTLG